MHMYCPFSDEQLQSMALKAKTSTEEILDQWYDHAAQSISKWYQEANKQGIRFSVYMKKIDQELKPTFKEYAPQKSP